MYDKLDWLIDTDFFYTKAYRILKFKEVTEENNIFDRYDILGITLELNLY